MAINSVARLNKVSYDSDKCGISIERFNSSEWNIIVQWRFCQTPREC